ncbi:S9 family peptidase [Metabacillus sp. RGM 3146]|uniref:S9 family peptidase n=1 Tax=Metabacillus sp. RGM 3146 TaxID=3401092 RepID=UPI003B9D573A
MKTHTKKRVKAEDLYCLKSLTDPRLSPDGKGAVYVQTSINKETHSYTSHLYYYDFSMNKSSQWTFGEHRDHSPRWSPDGSKIAFLSNRSGEFELYVMNLAGGEAKRLTHSPHRVSGPVWSPDGVHLLFSVSLSKNESIQEKKENNNGPEALIVRNMGYKSDAGGFLKDRKSQVFIVNLQTEEIRQLTNEKEGAADPAYHPDGQKIAFTSDQSENPDLSLISDIFLMDLNDLKPVKLTQERGFFGNLAFSPDGKYLASLGNEKEYLSASSSKLWLYHMESGEFSCLTEGWDVHISDSAAGDVLFGNVFPGIQWTEDSEGFYFIASEQGSTAVYYGSPDGSVFPVRSENEHVFALSLNPSDHSSVVGISTPDAPGELYYLDYKTGESRRLTDANKQYIEETAIIKPEIISFKAEDGLEIHGWFMKPFGYEAGRKYPLLLEIHGGPHKMYANTYVHEFQVLASAGYAVLYVNPRGSQGYGQQFANLVRGDYGGDDYRDLMTAVDYALKEFPFIDEERLGVTGGSYGGFMTNWIVGHTDRFKAAVTQRCISNWLSFYGVSDIGYYFTEWEVGSSLFENPEKLWEHSPLKYVKNVNTPLLILHSEKDYRCPIEQAEQLFISLKRLEKETQFIRFPDSNHDLSRNGHPKLRVERLGFIQSWFAQHLGKH